MNVTSTKTRTSIKTDSQGYVTLTYSPYLNWDDDVVTRIFMCPMDGGYVREKINGEWKQICDRLSTRGNTLMAPSREALADVIRREYRAMRRDDEKRERL